MDRCFECYWAMLNISPRLLVLVILLCTSSKFALNKAFATWIIIAIHLVNKVDAEVFSHLVLWRHVKTPVSSGFSQVERTADLTNPCLELTKETLQSELVHESAAECENFYESVYLPQLSRMCGWQNTDPTIFNHRLRRELFVRPPTLISGSLNRTAGSRLLNVQQINTISLVNTRLIVNNQVLKRLVREWSLGRLSWEFFDFFNITLPCGLDCAFDLLKPITCSLNDENTKLKIVVIIPIISKTLQLVEADPFTLIRQTANTTCVFRYTGPTRAVISTTNNCLHAVTLASNNYIISPSSECRDSFNETSIHRYFAQDYCQPKHPSDAMDYIQLKPYNGLTLVYCNGNTFTFNGIVSNCSDAPISISSSRTFKINNRTYTELHSELKYQKDHNPAWTDQVNLQLKPTNRVNTVIHSMINSNSNAILLLNSNCFFVCICGIYVYLVNILDAMF